MGRLNSFRVVMLFNCMVVRQMPLLANTIYRWQQTFHFLPKIVSIDSFLDYWTNRHLENTVGKVVVFLYSVIENFTFWLGRKCFSNNYFIISADSVYNWNEIWKIMLQNVGWQMQRKWRRWKFEAMRRVGEEGRKDEGEGS